MCGTWRWNLWSGCSVNGNNRMNGVSGLTMGYVRIRSIEDSEWVDLWLNKVAWKWKRKAGEVDSFVL